MEPLALGPSVLDPQHLIATFGLIGIMVAIFAECGLLVGFFLPGDSLLFTAGLLVSDGKYVPGNLFVVSALIAVAAVAGNQTGYAIGRRAGPAVFNRPDSRFFRQEYVEKAAEFFDRYGARAIVLARFVPIVRTFITVMAGASRMRYRTYLIYTVVGGILWAFGVTTLGYFLGQVDFIRNNIELILGGVIALSVIPIGIQFWGAARYSRRVRKEAEASSQTPAEDEQTP